MNPLLAVSATLSAVNVLLALAVLAVYWRNHAELRSPFTYALVLFAVFLVVHNALFVYDYLTMMVDDGEPGWLRFAETALQTAGGFALLRATWR